METGKKLDTQNKIHAFPPVISIQYALCSTTFRSFALTASRGDEITIKYDAKISRLNTNPPNSIIGQAVLEGLNFTKEFGCLDPYPVESGFTNGMCYAFLRQKDMAKLVQSGSMTLTIKLRLLNANVSELEAAGVNCDGLRLDVLKPAEDPKTAQNSTSTLIPAIVTELDEQYAKVRQGCFTMRTAIMPKYAKTFRFGSIE